MTTSEVTRVDPERIRHVAGNRQSGIAAVADRIAEAVDPGVLDQHSHAAGPREGYGHRPEPPWIQLLAEAIRDAQAERSLDAGEDLDQLAFDLNAYLLLANAQYVALQNRMPIARAKTAIAARLAPAGAAATA